LLAPTLIGADMFSSGGLAVGGTQVAPLVIKAQIRMSDKAQPLMAKKRIELFLCSMLFNLLNYLLIFILLFFLFKTL
jgi:hypothetical protein